MKTYGRYIIKKILIAILVIFVISIFVFLLMHLIPGDPVKPVSYTHLVCMIVHLIMRWKCVGFRLLF